MWSDVGEWWGRGFALVVELRGSAMALLWRRAVLVQCRSGVGRNWLMVEP